MGPETLSMSLINHVPSPAFGIVWGLTPPLMPILPSMQISYKLYFKALALLKSIVEYRINSDKYQIRFYLYDTFSQNNYDNMGSERITRNKKAVMELQSLYSPVKSLIETRLSEFKRLWKRGSQKDIFSELIFCLLTPQSKAKSCDHAVGCLLEKDLVLNGTQRQIAKELRTKTRFHNNKAGYIIEARRSFTYKGEIIIKDKIDAFRNPKDTREWLTANVKGLGLKEASHFLRNIGKGEKLAILDRHILRNLVSLGVILEVPKSISRKKYFEIEERMIEFSRRIGIPLAHLDLLLWYKETGEVFK
jgi:N-glycosylase/DNA lyase